MNAAVTAAQIGSSPRCRSCGSPIWFGRTAKGRRMPMDPAPVEDGNVVVDADLLVLDRLADLSDGAPVRVLVKGEIVDIDVPRYRSHFATCPKPHRPRREERKRKASRAKARAMGMEQRA